MRGLQQDDVEQPTKHLKLKKRAIIVGMVVPAFLILLGLSIFESLWLFWTEWRQQWRDIKREWKDPSEFY